MRLIDANALINEAMERYCSDCERRKGVKNGKWKIVYSIGDAPCRACGTGDMIDELEDAPTIEERKKGMWIDYSDEGYVECPFCHSATNCDDNIKELHFCFSCGAEMRGEANE